MIGRFAAIWSLSLVLIVAGCAPSPQVTPLPSPEELMDPAQPALMGATNGLEMRVWVTQDQDDVLADAIDRYEALPTPMPDSVRRAWRASGFRVIAIPTDALSELRTKIRVIGPEQRDWFGQSPDWSEAVRGREVRAGTPIELADGIMKSPAGRLRMLMRCWTTPGESIVEPAMHLELAVQLERRVSVRSPFELPSMQSELEAGVIFPRLRAAMRVPSGTALVIVPMPDRIDHTADATDAGNDMPTEPGPAGHAKPGSGSGARGDVDPAVAGLPEGPPVPLTPTLGEAMLTSAMPGTIDPVRRRAVIVLLPRLPERFRLSAADAPASVPLRR
ncbi:MAG: hypothetical protein AAF937_03555 [Planctomycetota bacterium]